VRFVTDNVVLGKFFFEYFSFSLSVLLDTCLHLRVAFTGMKEGRSLGTLQKVMLCCKSVSIRQKSALIFFQDTMLTSLFSYYSYQKGEQTKAGSLLRK